MSHDTESCACLNCGAQLDAASNVTGERQPGPGDFTMCAYCGHLMAYTETGFREPTKEEQIELAGDPALRLTSEIVGEFQAALKARGSR